MSAPDIFLSYSREDQAAARRFAETFEAEGFSVWWDVTLRSGEAYDQVTEEALRTAKAVVVLWSPRSVVSRWVRAEATVADRNRTLVPARIEACELPIMFELTQTADLAHWQGGASDPAWRAFLADVRRFVEARTVGEGAERPVQAMSKPRPGRARPSIAVLPFINRSGLAEDDAFADLMVEDLTAALSTATLVDSRRMKVIASSTGVACRTGARDLREIGRELGARYLLEGNVRRSGDNIRVTAQLVEAEGGDILWTQRFDRPFSELATLQEDLVTELAAHLAVQISRVETEHALGKHEVISFEEAIIRLSHYSTLGTRSGTEAAVAEARRAVELKPDDGAAYANLAAMQAHLAHLRGGDPGLEQDAASNIERARLFDAGDPLALVATATALAWLRKPDDAVRVARRAVAMSPNFDTARYALGSALARLGRANEAIVELAAGERLAPNGVRTNYVQRWRSVAHLQVDRLVDALDSAVQSLRLLPDIDSLLQHMLCLAKLGAWVDAREAMRQLLDEDPELSGTLAESLVRDLYCGSKKADEFGTIIRKLWDEAAAEGKPA